MLSRWNLRHFVGHRCTTRRGVLGCMLWTFSSVRLKRERVHRTLFHVTIGFHPQCSNLSSQEKKNLALFKSHLQLGTIHSMRRSYQQIRPFMIFFFLSLQYVHTRTSRVLCTRCSKVDKSVFNERRNICECWIISRACILSTRCFCSRCSLTSPPTIYFPVFLFFVALALTSFLLAALQRCSVAVCNQIPSDVRVRGNSPICLCVMYINVTYISNKRRADTCLYDQRFDFFAVEKANVLTWDQSASLPLWFRWRVFKLVWSLCCQRWDQLGTDGLETSRNPHQYYLLPLCFWEASAAGLKMKTFLMFDQTCQMLF